MSDFVSAAACNTMSQFTAQVCTAQVLTAALTVKFSSSCRSVQLLLTALQRNSSTVSQQMLEIIFCGKYFCGVHLFCSSGAEWGLLPRVSFCHDMLHLLETLSLNRRNDQNENEFGSKQVMILFYHQMMIDNGNE